MYQEKGKINIQKEAGKGLYDKKDGKSRSGHIPLKVPIVKFSSRLGFQH